MIRIAIILFFCYSIIHAQDTSATALDYKITATYGIIFVKPGHINDHIMKSNDVSENYERPVDSFPEIAVSFSNRLEEGAHITARIGRIYMTNKYDLIIAETTTSSNVVGYSNGTVQEKYTMYPLSAGVGWATRSFGSQIQIEFVYALCYIEEEQSIISSTGVRNKYLHTLSSSSYGLRFSGSTTIKFTELIGITIETGYRHLVFDDFSDERTNKQYNIEFDTNGFNTAIGLSITF
ncbi:MAG: hypothetical protein JXA06_04320 [Bacteroidetes bacterium]|nr:hypothetical protein [Bacteroidota bacterium]